MSETSQRCVHCKHRAWAKHWFAMTVPEYNAMRRAMLLKEPHHETSARPTGPEPVPAACRTLRRVRARVFGHLPAWVGTHHCAMFPLQGTGGVPGGSRGAQLAAAAGGVRVSRLYVIEPGAAERCLRSEARRCALAERLGVPVERVPVDVGSGPAVRLPSRRALGHDEGEER